MGLSKDQDIGFVFRSCIICCSVIFSILRLISGQECKRAPSGDSYLGTSSSSADGKSCQPWSQTMHASLPYGTHESNENFCRLATVTGENYPATPWCYTNNDTSVCDIEFCGKLFRWYAKSENTWLNRIEHCIVDCEDTRQMFALIAKYMGPTWGSSGANRTQVGPMLAPITLLSG